MDSNFENLCLPDLKTNSCYFLLKNDYNELLYKQRINELYDNSKNMSIATRTKKEEDHYSINLNNISFNKTSNKSNNSKKSNKTNNSNQLNKLNISNLNMDYYVIIKVNNANLNYKSLTISSAINRVEPSIQIYSYKLIYLETIINLKLDNKPQQYKLKIIRNQKNQGEIRFKIDNVIKEKININNYYERQISYLIDQDFDNIEFDSKNNITLFVKFDYKMQGTNIEEISYGATPRHISNSNEFPLLFYIKSINDKGLDLNIFLTNKIGNGNLDIFGEYINFNAITLIDEGKSIINEEPFNQYDIKGIYDNGIQTGIINFEKNSSDEYYLVVIKLSNDNSIPNNANLSSGIIINAYPRENRDNVIPSGKYIRGIYDLEENNKGKIYYIEGNYNCTIFFSSNYKNLQIVIDNNDNNTFVENQSIGYAQIYRIKGYIDKFTIKLINNININNSVIDINYLFKYEIKNKEKNPKKKPKFPGNKSSEFENDKQDNENDNQENRNISEKNIETIINNGILKGNKRDILISVVNNRTNEYIPNKKCNYSYYLRLFQKNDILEDEELNTLAFPSSTTYYYNQSLNNHINSQVNFTLENIYNDEDYQGYLIIKSNPFFQDFYEVQSFTIGQYSNEGKGGKDKIYLIIGLIVMISIIFIIILVFSIFLIRMLKKNKDLEEKVRNISYVIKDDDSTSSSLDDELNPKVAYV